MMSLRNRGALAVPGHGRRVQRVSGWRLMLVLLWSAVVAPNLAVAQSTPFPAGAALHAETLTAMSRHIRQSGRDVRAIVILRGGKVAFAWHARNSSPERAHRVFSVTKSVLSLLLGIALAETPGVSVGTTLDEVLRDELDAVEAARGQGQAPVQMRKLTLADLLTMRSGLPESRAPGALFKRMHRDRDRLRFALSQPVRIAPGTRFRYGNIDPQILIGVLESMTGQRAFDYAADRLFAPMGFRNYRWDPADGRGLVPGGYGLELRTIDMARLGQLVLQRGRWGAAELVPAAWVASSTRPHVQRFYGYMWWTRVSAGRYGSVAALGVRGQVVQIIPELDLVFAMSAMLPRAVRQQFRRELIDKFVLAAVARVRDGGNDADAERRLREELETARRYAP